MSGADESIPESVQELIEDFHAVPDADRLQLLLEFSRSLPELPERYGEHPEQLEQVGHPRRSQPDVIAKMVDRVVLHRLEGLLLR